ncbi:MAG: T9SS type A sorting domain-containing protein [candidate division WOR-3 bacterium]|nr:MAG: T9SS type A sorting domain-containing protein [candidate division WOR-3 bacterium]
MKVLCAVVLLGSMLFGQVIQYEEYFTGGVTQLQWEQWVGHSNMEVINDPTSPGGDSWVGEVWSDSVGTPIAAMYSGEYSLTDCSVEAWIYTVVSPMMAPYNGVCIRMDTATNQTYNFVSDFDGDARLLLRHMVGATVSIIREWTDAEIPGGVPSTSSWHKFKVEMVADSIWAYYDDSLLADCPFVDDRIAQGFFGIYSFTIFGDWTRCDNIIVTAPNAISEHESQTINTVSVYPNPFSTQTTFSFGIAQSAESIGLRVYDAAGRLVEDLTSRMSVIGDQASVRWDGSSVAPGVYFVTDGTGVQLQKVVKLR